jgi:hypothetical protein
MLGADLAVTGLALTPLSERVASHPGLERWLGPGLGRWVGRLAEQPWPRDLVAFAIQLNHQRSGGPSYLLGERAMRGWRHYYLVAIALKVPIGVFVLAAARLLPARETRDATRAGAEPGAARSWRARGAPFNTMLWVVPLGYLAICSIGSSRNYGLRYLLPVAPVAIVWLSGLASGRRWQRLCAVAGVVLIAAATAGVYPHFLAFFNVLAGGRDGGRLMLADSNFDWGQGARALARLQSARPELRDLTVYYFGATDPGHYGVVGRRHVIDAGTVHAGLPAEFECDTAYVAVSSSLRWGPWGPDGYFAPLDLAAPVAWTDDGTIAVFQCPSHHSNAAMARTPR